MISNQSLRNKIILITKILFLEIYSFLTKKYGAWILYDPQFNKGTYFLWFLPVLIFLFGGAIILKKLINIKK